MRRNFDKGQANGSHKYAVLARVLPFMSPEALKPFTDLALSRLSFPMTKGSANIALEITADLLKEKGRARLKEHGAKVCASDEKAT
jgi:hypothetical protein